MDAYIYRAELYCGECGRKLCADLTPPADPDCYDSDDYPKGPYPDSGGEADSPQHCVGCGVYLCNPLTDDGVAYVIEYLAEAVRRGKACDVERAWARDLHDYYLSDSQQETLEQFDNLKDLTTGQR